MPQLGGHSDPQSANTSSIITPSSHSSWTGDLLPGTPTPASPSETHGWGRREYTTIWNKYNWRRGSVCLFDSPCWLRLEGELPISYPTHRCRNRDRSCERENEGISKNDRGKLRQLAGGIVPACHPAGSRCISGEGSPSHTPPVIVPGVPGGDGKRV